MLQVKFSIFLTLTLFFVHSIAQDNLIELNREVQRLEKEIAKEKKFHAQEIKQNEGFQKQKKNKSSNIKKQIQNLNKQIKETKKRNSTISQQTDSINQIVQNLNTQSELLLTDLKKSIENWNKDLSNTFPHGQKKVSRQLQSLYQKITQKKNSPINALNNFYQIILTMITQGYHFENFYGTYTDLAGSFHDGNYFRAGNLLLFFISSDQKQVSYLTYKNNQYVWNDSPNLRIRRELIKAFNIVQGKTSPELVFLPIQIHSIQNESTTSKGIAQ